MKIDKETIAVIEIVILWTAFIVSFQDMFKIIYNMKKYKLKYIATAILITLFLVYAGIDLAKENKEYNILNKVYERIR